LKSIASAPGKVILFGEHFVVYGIKAILCSINKRVEVTSITTPEETFTVKSNLGSISIPRSKSIQEINSPFLPFLYLEKKIAEEFEHSGGISIDINSAILEGVGLGSSSACCVAAAASISKLFSNYSKEEILKLAIEAEKTIFKDASGADSTVTTYGGIIEYDKKSGFKKINSKFNIDLVIANSGTIHSTNTVVQNVTKFKEKNESDFFNLCKKESDLIQKVIPLIINNDLKSIGKVMNQNQEFLEQIGVSNDVLRKMIEIANKTSYGSKITGAGLGGCIISLVDETNMAETMENLKKNNYECFSVKIDSIGLDTF
jgi:mevalonate kinase